MRLFISYASEDRKDFAEPLAQELSKNYEVWFAPYELKVGDSLFKKINEGLGSCDYGVVILSQHFFAKKWPPAELNGLFALEEPSRKIILPVWRDVSEEDIKKYSPILADRVAVNGSDGIQAVVAALRLAIDASGRQKELSAVGPLIEKFRELAETVQEKQDRKQLLKGKDGIHQVAKAAGQLFDIVQEALSQVAALNALSFEFHRRESEVLNVSGKYGLRLVLALDTGLIFRRARWATLTTAVVEDRIVNGPATLSRRRFKPAVRRGLEIAWKPEGDEEVLSAEEVARDALERYRRELEQAALCTRL